MSLDAVQTEILEPMQRLFLPPRNMEPDQQTLVLKSYGDVLKGYEASDLREAWVAVISTHATRSWPLPAALLLAVRRSRSERNAAEKPAERTDKDFAAKRLAWDKIRCTKMARDAANAGFAWSLKCAVMNDGKSAEQIDLRELSAEHNSAERTAESLQKGERVWDRTREKWVEFSDENAALALRMHRNIQVREAETAEEIRRHT